jgi:hypothetical protein
LRENSQALKPEERDRERERQRERQRERERERGMQYDFVKNELDGRRTMAFRFETRQNEKKKCH